MPTEMYGESWIADLLTSDDIMLYMAGFGMTRGIWRYLLRIHGMNYTEVINMSSAANSTWIDNSKNYLLYVMSIIFARQN